MKAQKDSIEQLKNEKYSDALLDEKYQIAEERLAVNIEDNMPYY
ncbi:hypothetical protein [Chryseobacterium gallinarum]|nr:hypothetical protein [Chryseobacterium gallinarum]